MTTYYLRAAGNDSNAGTKKEKAWRTLERASQAAYAPGDRLILETDAAFSGTLTLQLRADETERNAPVTVEAMGTGRATIDAGTGAGIVVINGAGVRLRNLLLIGSGREKGNAKSGISFWMNRPGNTRLRGIRIERVTARGFGDSGISIGATPTDQSRSGFSDIHLANVETFDNGDAGISFYGIFRTDRDGWNHSDVTLRQCRAYRNRGIADKGSHSGNGIVLGQVTSAKIERCVAFENGENSNYGGGGPVGIWAWDSNQIVIERCESYDNRSRTLDGGGFDLDGGVTNSILRHNKSRNNAGAGFMVYQFQGARPCFGCEVYNNVSENDGRTNLGGLFAGGGIQGAIFHHNHVIVSPRGSATLAYAAGVDEYDNGAVEFRDNDFTSLDGAPLVHAPKPRGTVRFIRNKYQARSAFLIVWNGARYDSLSEWQKQHETESRAD